MDLLSDLRKRFIDPVASSLSNAGKMIQQDFNRSQLGRTINTAQQIGNTPQFQNFVKPIKQEAINFATQQAPAAQRITALTQLQTPWGQQALRDRVNDFQRNGLQQGATNLGLDVFNTGKFTANILGGQKLLAGGLLNGVKAMGLNAGIGGTLNKAMGGSFSEGAGQGAAITPSIAGITRITNPLIERTTSRLAPRIAPGLVNNKVGNYLTSSTLRGLQNIPEGAVIDATLNRRPLSAGSVALDFASGFLPGGNRVRGAADSGNVDELIKQGKALGLDGINPRAFNLPQEDKQAAMAALDILRYENKKIATPEDRRYALQTIQNLLDAVAPGYKNKKTKQALDAVEWIIQTNEQVPGEFRTKLPKAGLVEDGYFQEPYKKGDIAKLEKDLKTAIGDKSTRSVQGLSFMDELEYAAKEGNQSAQKQLQEIRRIEAELEFAKIARNQAKVKVRPQAQIQKEVGENGQRVVVDAFGGMRTPVEIVENQNGKLRVKLLNDSSLGNKGEIKRIGEQYIVSRNIDDVNDFIKAFDTNGNIPKLREDLRSAENIFKELGLKLDNSPSPQKSFTQKGSFTNTRADQIAGKFRTPESQTMQPAKISDQKTADTQAPAWLDEGRANSGIRPEVQKATERLNRGQSPLSQPQKVGNQPFDDIVNKSDLNVKQKVGLLDWFRTPDRVLEKIGMGNEAILIRRKYDDYLAELPKEIERVTEWSKRADSPESSKYIFQYLDGQKVNLSENDLAIAKEIKGYLAQWADRLGLPKDKRVTNYITHIFEKDFIQKEFDPEIAALIRDKVAGSVYDPFVQQRLGKMGYVEDAWRALDAYVKRATRKANMDEALSIVSKKAEKLEESQYSYVKSYIDRVNMRPTTTDNLIDNTIKQFAGYRFGQRPVTSLTQKLRQMVYRGTLGLNIGSALRNLTQGANTYAKLGEKYTIVGYSKLAQKMVARDLKELHEQGVLKNDFIQDRTLNATRKFWEKLDKGLFFFFEGAEKINRGAAYFGAKSKALNQGMSEHQAIEYAKKIVRDTQFTFGSVDTPKVLSSDIAKTLGQFQSYNLKQSEFLIEMAKNKEFAGLIRYGVASLGFMFTVGQLIGIKPQDLIPFANNLSEGRFPVPPTVQAVGNTLSGVFGSKDQYGNEMDLGDRANLIANSAIPFVPGGVQILNKTIPGLQDVSRGYATSDFGAKRLFNTLTGNEGRVKFPIEQNASNTIRAGLFGTSNLPASREYKNEQRTPLGDNQSLIFKQSADRVGTYNQIIKAREQNSKIEDVKKSVGGGGSQLADNKIIYNDSGEVKTIDLSPPSKGVGIGAFANRDWNITKAREVWNANIPESQKNEALNKLGVKPEDARYDALANYSVDIKTQYLSSKSQSKEELFKNILSGRKRSIGDNIFASDGVIDNLVDEGKLTKEEGKALKAIDYNKDGTLKKSTGKGRGKKPTLPKLEHVEIKFNKAKRVKYKTVKPKKVKEYKLKKVKIRKVKSLT